MNFGLVRQLPSNRAQPDRPDVHLEAVKKNIFQDYVRRVDLHEQTN